jgi:cell division septal protein FtsQ
MAARRHRRRRSFELTVPAALKLRRRVQKRGPKHRAGEELPTSPVVWSRLVSAALAIACLGLLAWFWIDADFYVYAAEVEGSSQLPPGEILRASGVHGYSVFHVDGARVAERVMSEYPSIEWVGVECQLPGRVLIRVEESEARFVWSDGLASYAVDSRGYVLPLRLEPREGLISIRDLDARPVGPSDRVPLVALRAAEELHQLLPEAYAFEYSDERGISLRDARGWVIHFGDSESLALKVASMYAVLQDVADKGRSIRFIDLRFAGTPYYE